MFQIRSKNEHLVRSWALANYFCLRENLRVFSYSWSILFSNPTWASSSVIWIPPYWYPIAICGTLACTSKGIHLCERKVFDIGISTDIASFRPSWRPQDTPFDVVCHCGSCWIYDTVVVGLHGSQWWYGRNWGTFLVLFFRLWFHITFPKTKIEPEHGPLEE